MKNMVVIDANVILRYLIGDHPKHFAQANKFMTGVLSGEVNAFIGEGVLVECVYVMLKVYSVPRKEIADKLLGLMSYRGIVIDDRLSLTNALRLFQDSKIDIVDAIVLATAEHREWKIFSFDKDINKMAKRKGWQPKE